MQLKHPIILFDGVCNLCNGTVDFIIKRDVGENFRFGSLQSEAGRKLAVECGVGTETDSVVLLASGKVFLKSAAALEIARQLPFPWKMAVIFKVVPPGWRDKIYDWVARNRYRWFGKKETCRLPTKNERTLFVESITDFDALTNSES